MTLRNLMLATTAASMLLGTAGLAVFTSGSPARANAASSSEHPIGQLKQQGNRPDGAGRNQAQRRGERLAAAAAELGVSETELRTALGLLPRQPIAPDFAGAAAQLGTTETELRYALRPATQPGRGPRGRRPDFAAVAQQYGVSTETLLSALGVPAERPQPDITAAAQQLGVSEDELRNALRPNCRWD
jgi:hypothetical protein